MIMERTLAQHIYSNTQETLGIYNKNYCLQMVGLMTGLVILFQ